MKPLVYDLTMEQWEAWAAEHDLPKFRAAQIFDWLYVKRITDFAAMTNLPKALREKLQEEFRFAALDEITHMKSQDGTIKFLFGLHDGHAIETVIMKHNYGYSVCVTTQVGCRIGLHVLRVHAWRLEAQFDRGRDCCAGCQMSAIA